MTFFRATIIVLLPVAFCFSKCRAFSPNHHHPVVTNSRQHGHTGTTPSTLHKGVLVPRDMDFFFFNDDDNIGDPHYHHENKYLLAKARECAFSDTSTPAQATRMLRRILELQSNCLSGSMLGEAICQDDVDEWANVVAHLRVKQTAGEQQERTTAVVTHPAKYSLATTATTMAVAILLMVAAPTILHHNSAPFTTQEWMWSMRDGYWPQMVAK